MNQLGTEEFEECLLHIDDTLALAVIATQVFLVGYLVEVVVGFFHPGVGFVDVAEVGGQLFDVLLLRLDGATFIEDNEAESLHGHIVVEGAVKTAAAFNGVEGRDEIDLLAKKAIAIPEDAVEFAVVVGGGNGA